MFEVCVWFWVVVDLFICWLVVYSLVGVGAGVCGELVVCCNCGGLYLVLLWV